MRQISFEVTEDAYQLLADAGQRHQLDVQSYVRVMLERMAEDDYWGRLALDAKEEGYLGVQESEALLNELRNAKD